MQEIKIINVKQIKSNLNSLRIQEDKFSQNKARLQVQWE
jgi:hypothetical protein